MTRPQTDEPRLTRNDLPMEAADALVAFAAYLLPARMDAGGWVDDALSDGPGQPLARLLAAALATPASSEGMDPESWSAWLIERGQPEGHVPPIYAVTWTKDGDATVTDWTDDPFRAAQIPDKAEAEKLMGLWNSAPARVVQHGFTCEHRESRCLHCERIVPRNDTPKPEPGGTER